MAERNHSRFSRNSLLKSKGNKLQLYLRALGADHSSYSLICCGRHHAACAVIYTLTEVGYYHSFVAAPSPDDVLSLIIFYWSKLLVSHRIS